MFKSIEEPTAKLKYLNFKLSFTISYSTHPVKIYHNTQPVLDSIDIKISTIDEIKKFSFEGFSPHDTTQVVNCELKFESRILPINNICTFKKQNNQYVDDETIKNYSDIYFNGYLEIKFTKEWIEHNILNGCRLNGYVSWFEKKIQQEEIFCVGDSYTEGAGVDENDNWPSLLKKNNIFNFNFGVGGNSHDGCYKNIEYILKHSKNVKQIICLLPPPTRKLLQFELMDKKVFVPITVENYGLNLPNALRPSILDTRKLIFNKEYIEKDWIKTCEKIINICEQYNVTCWLTTWDQDSYKYIPGNNKLPCFPKLDIFTERASDGSHPHRKHYELFVNSIKSYIDK